MENSQTTHSCSRQADLLPPVGSNPEALALEHTLRLPTAFESLQAKPEARSPLFGRLLPEPSKHTSA